MSPLKTIFAFSFCILWLSSCKTYQNAMFQDANSMQISQAIDKLNSEYLIQPGDEITIKLYTRQGAQLIEAIRSSVTSSPETSTQSGQAVYVVSNEGKIVLPLLGEMKVDKMTESKLKELLEKKFERDYIQPFVMLRIENRRVFLFKGNTAAVVNLNKTPTNIFEVIAKSGGLERQMSSSDILIIRGDLKKPTIYKVNLQTFQGIQNSEIILQSKDIVYIPEKQRKLYHAMNDITPIVTTPLLVLSGILSTVVLIVTVTK
ncbi:MAG: polysaccharide biosynthesis/export family protein [Chitinophagales bacterium]|nr:polysaccharide biosynthesis/export family protein [Chitinophagales bacterium]